MSFPLALLALVLAFATCHSQTYDYIVVGGGTNGLVVANRLTETSSVSVLVIEAGDSVYNNDAVKDTGGYGRAFGTSIDWQYQTTAQKLGDNKAHVLRQGKAIGGTSTINGMSYTRADDVQIDAWETLGNTGWNWKNLLHYYLKSESYQIPGPNQIKGGASYVPAYHGFKGPLKVGYTNKTATDSLASTINSTFQSLGVPWSRDVSGGKMRGFTVYPRTVDPIASVREDAARAYYWPYTSRTNLHMMTNTAVTKILWASGSGANFTASGVQVTKSDGSTAIVNATKEVILAAGAIKTPMLLEVSGIGNPSILSKYSIPVKVSLPGVGENLHDQINNAMSYSNAGNPQYSGERGYAGYVNATDLFGSQTASVASAVQAALPSYAAAQAAANNNATSAADLLAIFQIQHRLLFTNQVPAAELIFYPNGNALGAEFWALLPFARGSVHVSGASIASAPIIDPKYFLHAWDAQAQVASAKYIRRLFGAAPLKTLVAGEQSPGTGSVAANANDDAWAGWLKANFRSNYHLLSTAIMMPRAKGGVVDPRLKVYGTTNVRVVDASVVPLQLCGHLMSTLYAVAERAADLIKADHP